MNKYKLSEKEAYMAMFYYLEELYDHQGFDELGGLLGSMRLLDDSAPADSSVLEDWEQSIKKALQAQ